MTTPRYPFVAVDVTEDDAEEAGALLFELGAQGVEQRDATTLVRAAAGKVTLVASFENEQAARAAMAEVDAAWSPRLEEVVGDDWRDEWKKHFEPFRICAGVVVCPPWRDAREAKAAPGERVVVLEPGRAFGTGLHETTSLVAGVLADLAGRPGAASGAPVLRGASVLDVGCGSGVLALAALALGAASARAIDVDPDAVAVTRENAERNGLAARVVADETPAARLAGTFPVVLANIEARPLIELAPAIVPRVAPGGTLVLSGILAPDVVPGQLDQVLHAYADLDEQEIRRKGEWVAVVLRARAAGAS
jgi:ribosomal protein L11 methyltransferase